MNGVSQVSASRADCPTAWISCAEVCRMIGAHHRVVRRLAAEGKIRTRTVVGCKPRYAAADALGLLTYGGDLP